MIEFAKPFLVGVVHLPPLPGHPRHRINVNDIIESAANCAQTLENAGFDGVILENFGDAPFTAGSVDPSTVAAMAVIAFHVHSATNLHLGINVLRNDARSALAIAAATGAQFVRINVHTGVCATDQGIIQGRADETIRYRANLATDIAILADVHVKHAVPLSQPDIAQAAQETVYRGGADAIIVTGSATGRPADAEDLRKVRDAVPDRPIFVGSGVSADTVSKILTIADGVIVGTAIKRDGITHHPVDAHRAATFVRNARS